MTESEWLNCADPTPMLEFLRGKASERKLRLFACACCRRIWSLLLNEPEAGTSVERVERYTEGLAEKSDFDAMADEVDRMPEDTDPKVVPGEPETDEEFRSSLDRSMLRTVIAMAVTRTEASVYDISDRTLVCDHGTIMKSVTDAARYAAMTVGRAAIIAKSAHERAAEMELDQTEMFCQCQMVRDIFQNPFRPVAINPAWLTSTVVSLATAIYEERSLPSGELDPARLAVLADALEEAGGPRELVAHLHGPGPHVRGCFAVDLCLGLS
jgi:hypothetical protein